MSKRPDSFREVIELWSSRKAMASDVGVGGGPSWDASTVGKWWRRDKIPDEWWSAVCATTVARRNGVTEKLLAQLASRELVEAR